MRRLRILLAGVLAVGTTIAWSGVVHANSPALGDFCDLADETEEALAGGDVEDIDFTDPDALGDLYGEIADNIGDAAKQAPKKLKGAFKTVRKFYEQLADIDFNDPEDAADALIPSAKVQRAFDKITTYLIEECGLDDTGTGE
ncbi:MAG: hypothetical protein ACT4PI_03520 [Actinomycetota bacterium]